MSEESSPFSCSRLLRGSARILRAVCRILAANIFVLIKNALGKDADRGPLEAGAPQRFAGGTPATTVAILPTSYGELFGDADTEADAAGDEVASPGFTLSNSTSKMRVAFGPISPPVPPGP